eukprot:PhF_6_TR15027/c0_g1_i2/m.23569
MNVTDVWRLVVEFTPIFELTKCVRPLSRTLYQLAEEHAIVGLERMYKAEAYTDPRFSYSTMMQLYTYHRSLTYPRYNARELKCPNPSTPNKVIKISSSPDISLLVGSRPLLTKSGSFNVRTKFYDELRVGLYVLPNIQTRVNLDSFGYTLSNSSYFILSGGRRGGVHCGRELCCSKQAFKSGAVITVSFARTTKKNEEDKKNRFVLEGEWKVNGEVWEKTSIALREESVAIYPLVLLDAAND